MIYFGSALFALDRLDAMWMTVGTICAALCAVLIVAPARPAIAAGLRLAATVIGCASIVLFDLGSGNAGVIGQLFFCMPVLFAAVHLRVAGVVLVTTTALIGEATVVTTLLPPGEAILNFVFVGSIFISMAAALTRAGVVQDRVMEELHRHATVDALTGLVTRRSLDEAMHKALEAGREETGTALILIDVDRFKAIKDTYGHTVGDDALAHIARVLSACCRSGDVIARMGGDELAVLVPGCSWETASGRAADLIDAVRKAPLPLADGTAIELSISAGAAHAGRRSQNSRQLYESADAALYAVKRQRYAADTH